jgi:hypothetical protein
MKDLLNFLNKPETDSDDLAIILTGCTIFASVVIIILMAVGN